MADTVLIVDADLAGLRLDSYLTKQLSANGVSRAEAQRLIREGQVSVNGHHAKAARRLKPGDVVRLQNLPLRDSLITPEDLSLEILFEDEHCIVLNKAPGILVHPATSQVTGTLVNALLYHCPDLVGIGGERRPGIVHRLDKETSGIMVVAKTTAALQGLARQFRERQVQKEYVAIVWGKLPSRVGIIDIPVGRHRSDRRRMSSRYSLPKTREAVTEWEVENVFNLAGSCSSVPWVSLVKLRPKTGRTHQLRVHLADLGFPIVGDKIYGHKRGDRGRSRSSNLELHTFPRHALHAQRLAFVHPATERLMDFRVPLPQDMHHLVKLLGEHNNNDRSRSDPHGYG